MDGDGGVEIDNFTSSKVEEHAPLEIVHLNEYNPVLRLETIAAGLNKSLMLAVPSPEI